MDQRPPSGEVLMATGISGHVFGTGLSTAGGITLPWSKRETEVWIIESQIAVGDCGSVVLDQTTGMLYGFVVAHDPDTLMTYITPATSVFRSIVSRIGPRTATLASLFRIPEPHGGELTDSNAAQPNLEVAAEALQRVDGGIRADFLRAIESCTVQNHDGAPYLRTTRLLHWLRSQYSSGTSNVSLLLDHAYSHRLIVPVEEEALSTGPNTALLIFSILIELGRGDLIDVFSRRGVVDQTLPLDRFQLAGADQNVSSNLTEDFLRKQWAYCPVIFDLNMAQDLLASRIIPVHRREPINAKGGTSSIWHIEVLGDFVGPRLREVITNARFDPKSDQFGPRYHFALKSFSEGRKELFESEKTAFRALQSNTDRIVRYLGDFTQPEALLFQEELSHLSTIETLSSTGPRTYNLLLEYGDFDLDEYFAKFQPPFVFSEIRLFWEQMLNVAHALASIHRFETRRAGELQIFSGWHGDIKPDNILVINKQFKLADFGFARFNKQDAQETELIGGTKMFGAPETSVKSRTRSRVSQAIDIWSFGCVLSMAATWIVSGDGGLRDYQSIRNKEALRGGDSRLASDASFHDGEQVLPSVLEWHKLLRAGLRRSDSVTGLVLDLVDTQMLVGDSTQRATATAVSKVLQDILLEHNVSITEKEVLYDLRLTLDPRPSSFVASKVHSDPSFLITSRDYVPSQSTAISALRSTEKSAQSLGLPIMSVAQAIQWRREEERNRKLPWLKSRSRRDDIFSRYMQGRHFIFLIDNGETMEQHWDELSVIFEILLKMSLEVDKDDIEIFLTSGPPILVKGSKAVSALARGDVRPRHGVLTDIRRPLRGILARYQELATRERHDDFRRQSVAWEGKNDHIPFTIYFLTDGIWSGTADTSAVRDILIQFGEILGHSPRQRPMSVQFIKFGRDVAVSPLLHDPDSIRKDPPFPGILDLEPSDGNVYKMLLGSVVETYDHLEQDNVGDLKDITTRFNKIQTGRSQFVTETGSKDDLFRRPERYLFLREETIQALRDDVANPRLANTLLQKYFRPAEILRNSAEELLHLEIAKLQGKVAQEESIKAIGKEVRLGFLESHKRRQGRPHRFTYGSNVGANFSEDRMRAGNTAANRGRPIPDAYLCVTGEMDPEVYLDLYGVESRDMAPRNAEGEHWGKGWAEVPEVVEVTGFRANLQSQGKLSEEFRREFRGLMKLAARYKDAERLRKAFSEDRFFK